MRTAITTLCLLAIMGLVCQATEPPSFRKEIVPILANSCVKCHSGEEPKGGLDLTTHTGITRGGDSGVAVISGRADESLLLKLVQGTDEDRIMPAQGPRLTREQVQSLSRWIKAGMPWDAGFVIKGLRQASLAPRRPSLPAAGRLAANPVDRLLLAADPQLPLLETVSDRLYARRVYLDILGLLPPPEELEVFLAEGSIDKRETLVSALLARDKQYTEHWLTFWNDLLRNAYIGTGYIDGGRKPITNWLYQALYNNMPYDQFVHQLLSPTPESEGFVRGIIWRGVVNASQQREMQAAQNVSQVLLGTNLKCASCHDSYINHWKLSDAYGLAAIFAEGDLAIHKCNKPTGENAAVKFIYPELGQIDGSLPRAERMRQLADIMTSPQNGRLARTIVNRLWAQLMGRGIVEPVDDMDQAPFNQDLLDWLAVDLVDHGYDLKHTIRQIVTSRAYQLHAVGAPAPDETEFQFAGPVVRRMSAEQFVDAVNALTHSWPDAPAIKLPPLAPPSAQGQHPVRLTSRWIWNDKNARAAAPGGSVYFRTNLQLKKGFERALVSASCDNGFILYVNGHKALESDTWNKPGHAEITRFLHVGTNTLAIHGYNFPDETTGKGLEVQGDSPAGLIASLAIGYESNRPDQLQWESLGTNASWKWSHRAAEKWQAPGFEDSTWSVAVEIGNPNDGPWNIATPLLTSLIAAIDGQSDSSHTRTALVNDDILTRTLGRPNREQVLTRRSSIATTLQAIELTNGETLDTAIKRGASYWQQRSLESTDQLVREVYRQALSRTPTAQERRIAGQLFKEGESQQAIEDLLWIITMLPEFQLVY